jgi:hypothetical protein
LRRRWSKIKAVTALQVYEDSTIHGGGSSFGADLVARSGQ